MYFDAIRGCWKIAHNWVLDNLLNNLEIKNLDLILFFTENEADYANSRFIAYTSESLIFAIKEVMDRKEISLRKLSRLMGVEPTYLSSLFHLRYARSMQIYTLERICKALEVPIADVIRIARKSILEC